MDVSRAAREVFLTDIEYERKLGILYIAKKTSNLKQTIVFVCTIYFINKLLEEGRENKKKVNIIP